MLKKFFQQGVLPIGVAIDGSCVRLAQLKRLRSGYALIDATSFTIDPKLSDAPAAERLAGVTEGLARKLETGGFQGHRCVVSASDDLLRIRSVRQPRMPEDETDRALRLEGAERLGFKEGDAVELGWLLAGEARHGDDVRDELIVVGGRRADLEPLVDAVAAAGLRPVALEPAFLACGRAYSRMHRRAADQETVRIVIDVGRRSSGVIVLRGADVVFYKSLALGGARFDAAAAEALEISAQTAHELRRQRMTGASAESLSQEVDRALFESVRPLMEELAGEAALCLRYYTVTFRGQRPDVAIATGDEAREPGLAEALAAALGAPGQVGRPLEGIDVSGSATPMDRRGDMPEWGGAIGLSLREDSAAVVAGDGTEPERTEGAAERGSDQPARTLSSDHAARARREAA